MIAWVTELKDLSTEIKRRTRETAVLRKRKEELEEKIEKTLVEQDKPGVKYKDVAVILDKNKIKRLPKKKAQKEEDGINVLKHYGIDNAEKIFNEVMETLKGEEVQKNAIRLKDIHAYNNGNIQIPLPNANSKHKKK